VEPFRRELEKHKTTKALFGRVQRGQAAVLLVRSVLRPAFPYGEDTFQPCTGLQFFSMFTELSEALEVDVDMNTRGGMRGNTIEL
jgi:hypothetical protein